MSEKDTTLEEEVKETTEEESTTTEEVEEVTSKDKKVSEIIEENNVEETVPLKTFLELKKEKKALERDIVNLKDRADKGAPKSEINADLKSIADKYDVDSNFLEELSNIIYNKAKSDVEEKLNSKLQPLEEKDKREKINAAFNEHFDKVIEEMPEYKDVINKDVIKELSLLPQNKNKTFQQIIEDTYGKTISGKKTMETSTPRGGKDASLDMDRTRRDPEYLREVLANPDLKKEYNKGIENRINL